MFAIVEACGRQYKVEKGRYVDIDRADLKKDAEYTFDKVVMVCDGNGSKVGKPYIDGATVKGHVLSDLEENEVTGRTVSTVRSKKTIVYHMKPKKGTRKKVGYRSQFTRVMIDGINV